MGFQKSHNIHLDNIHINSACSFPMIFKKSFEILDSPAKSGSWSFQDSQRHWPKNCKRHISNHKMFWLLRPRSKTRFESKRIKILKMETLTT